MAKNKFIAWLKSAGIDVAKAIAETALGLIVADTAGVMEFDWRALLVACAVSGGMAVLMTVKALPKSE